MNINEMSNEELQVLIKKAQTELDERNRVRAAYLMDEIYKMIKELVSLYPNARFVFDDMCDEYPIYANELKEIYC